MEQIFKFVNKSKCSVVIAEAIILLDEILHWNSCLLARTKPTPNFVFQDHSGPLSYCQL